ncbi:phosphotransferase [Streptomyces sp. NPDC047072]|uniref:phosphotransferase n=1 Tax=Streptomyces sp. NPDC047072 TaxID=3154809 RepID=UPI0033DEE3C1
MSGGQRHTEPLDVHLILRRETADGPRVLLSRRAGAVYAAGLWHLPSGHLDGPVEDVVTALVRETREETGVLVDPADVRTGVTVHHRSPGGSARVGFFFEVRRWKGDPQIMEPAVCDGMDWFRLDALPVPMVAYCRAGLDAYRASARLAVHFQEPEDTIAYDPSTDRLRIIPTVDDLPGAQPGSAVREFTEQAVGRITGWEDASWAWAGSQVWRASNAFGGTWYVKVHQNPRFHDRQVRAYRTWVPSLGAAAPRLVAADDGLMTVVVTAVPGDPLYGAIHTPEQERRIFRQIGALARRIHQSAPARPAPEGSGPAAGKLERHLAAARPHLAGGDEEFVRALVERGRQLPPLEWVETHGDFQLRNILRAADGTLTVIDFERSEPGEVVRDLVRLSDAWAGRPDLYEALMAGYGRALTAVEEERLAVDAALDAVSGIQFGVANGVPDLVERGRRTLRRLRAAADSPTRTPGGVW